MLPGSILKLSSLLVKKKFTGKGNKEGAVQAFKDLQEAGLGQLIEIRAQRGTACVRLVDTLNKCKLKFAQPSPLTAL